MLVPPYCTSQWRCHSRERRLQSPMVIDRVTVHLRPRVSWDAFRRHIALTPAPRHPPPAPRREIWKTAQRLPAGMFEARCIRCEWNVPRHAVSNMTRIRSPDCGVSDDVVPPPGTSSHPSLKLLPQPPYATTVAPPASFTASLTAWIMLPGFALPCQAISSAVP